MKHTAKISYILIALFVISQFIGLFLIYTDASSSLQTINGTEQIVVQYKETAMGPRPEVSGAGSLLYVLVGVAIGTILLLLLMRFRSGIKIWTIWYFLAVTIALTISIGVFLPALFAFILALILAYAKIKFKTFFIHNLTEVLLYAGIALLFAPLFDVFWMIILLLIISVYDMYAVWKSKHMVSLAKFTSKSQVFAGLLINYKKTKTKTTIIRKQVPKQSQTLKQQKRKSNVHQAVLGGGDIIFPLLFGGVVFSYLLTQGFTKGIAFLLTLFIPIFSTVTLFLLLYYSKKDRFYPAMPFLSFGCFIGFILLQMLLFII